MNLVIFDRWNDQGDQKFDCFSVIFDYWKWMIKKIIWYKNNVIIKKNHIN